jgi:hypothetical protein
MLSGSFPLMYVSTPPASISPFVNSHFLVCFPMCYYKSSKFLELLEKFAGLQWHSQNFYFSHATVVHFHRVWTICWLCHVGPSREKVKTALPWVLFERCF